MGFTLAAFSAKNIPVVVAVMIISSLIESSMIFFQSKLLILLHIFLKHIASFWFNRLFIGDLSYLLAACKNNASCENVCRN